MEYEQNDIGEEDNDEPIANNKCINRILQFKIAHKEVDRKSINEFTD